MSDTKSSDGSTYSPPKLVVLGSVKSLTAGGASPGMENRRMPNRTPMT